MALNKTNINIAFNQGVDTKTDPKQVVPGKLVRLENAQFTAPGKFIKRNGYANLGTVNSGTGLATFQDELLTFTSTGISSFDEAIGSEILKGPAAFCGVGLNSVTATNTQQTAQDMSTNNSLSVFAWEDSAGGSRYTVIDTATGNHLVNNALLFATATIPKVVTLGNLSFIFYVDSADHTIKYKYVAPASPTVISSAVGVAAVSSTHPVYDVVVQGSKAFVGYLDNSAHPSLTYIASNFFQPLAPATIATTSVAPITVFSDAAVNEIYLGYYTGTVIKLAAYTNSLVQTMAPVTVETISNVASLTGAIMSGIGAVYYDITNAITYDYLIKHASISAHTVGSPSILVRSLGLGSKAFIQNGFIYVFGLYDSGLGQQLSTQLGAPQNKYFLLNSNGVAVGKLLSEPNTAGSFAPKQVLPAVTSQDGVHYYFAALLNMSTTGFAFQLNTTVVQMTLDFSTLPTKVELGNNLHIAAGAMLFMYDGAAVVEHGYNLYSEPTSAVIHTSGGALTTASYQYVVTYEWNDNQGQLHRSATSIPETVDTTDTTPTGITFTGTFSAKSTSIVASSVTGLFVGQVLTDSTTPGSLQAGTTITKITGTTLTIDLPTTASGAGDTLATSYTISNTLTIPTLRVTSKTGVNIVIYRTQGNGTIFFRAGQVANDKTVDTVSFLDTISDYSIDFNEQLYTTGGVVDNIEAPATSVITQYQNRLIALPSENRFQFMYSKQTGRTVGSALLLPVEFDAELFYMNVDQRGGPLTVVAPMDDKLILFKENSIFYEFGNGPAPNGTNNDFINPQLITTDCGCTEAASVVTMPMGLMFKSAKGIYLLDRALQTKYIGAEVEGFNSSTVTSAQLIPNTNQVRFSLDNGTTILVYDYFVNQWSTFTRLNATDSVIFGDLYTYLDTEKATLFQETPGQYTDDGEMISMSFTTSWLSFVGMQGFQRVYKMLLLGDYFSPHQLGIFLAYDFNPSVIQSEYINTQAYLKSTYGSPTGEVEGSTSPLGGQVSQQFQFRINPQVQKCQTIQVTIQEFPQTPYGQSMSLSGLAFEVGIKRGLYKLPAAQEVG